MLELLEDDEVVKLQPDNAINNKDIKISFILFMLSLLKPGLFYHSMIKNVNKKRKIVLFMLEYNKRGA